MIQLESMPELIQQRQEYLRSLAAPVKVGHRAVTTREAVGRLMIRLGQWIEGRRPEVSVEPRMAKSYRSA